MIEDLSLSIDCKKIIGKYRNFSPLNIFFTKEWLSERKKIPKDWPKKHKALQLKMSKIIEKDVPKQKEISEYISENRESN